MSDDRSDESETDASATDRRDSDGMDAPGGGPRRVVSNESVDDILESLDSGPAGSDSKPTLSEADRDALERRTVSGTVTGADVRATETSDGRDPTPPIDELDLSVDDLHDASDPSGTGSDGDGEEATGLLGRVRRLFSR